MQLQEEGEIIWLDYGVFYYGKCVDGLRPVLELVVVLVYGLFVDFRDLRLRCTFTFRKQAKRPKTKIIEKALPPIGPRLSMASKSTAPDGVDWGFLVCYGQSFHTLSDAKNTKRSKNKPDTGPYPLPTPA